MKFPVTEPASSWLDDVPVASDQTRFVRLVELLAQVPEDIYAEGRQMVKSLIDQNPSSVEECITDLDAAIQYLERHIDERPN
jgi:hypothetical protein